MAVRPREETDADPARRSQEAEQARLRLEVTRQRVRITRDQLARARELYKEAKREAKRARRKAASAQRNWKVVRKRVGRKTASAAKRKAKRSAVTHGTARHPAPRRTGKKSRSR